MVKRSNSLGGLPTDPQDPERPAALAVTSPIDREFPEPMNPAHRAAVEEGRAQFRRGEIATDQDVETAFRRFGP